MTIQSQGTQLADLESQRWAAEEAALQLGLLRECPYHGEPFKAPAAHAIAPRRKRSRPGARLDPHPDLLRLTQLSATYAEQCPYCVRDNAVP